MALESQKSDGNISFMLMKVIAYLKYEKPLTSRFEMFRANISQYFNK